MKKILMLIPALNAGGSERVMATLANEWSLEYEVTILTYASTDSFYKLNENVIHEYMNLMPPTGKIARIFSLPIIEIKRLTYLLKKIKQENYWFILAFTNTSNVFAALAKMISPKQKVIISERAAPEDYSSFMKKVIKNLYGKPDVLICQNDAVYEYFKKRWFKNKLIVLPNPVNFDDIPLERPTKIRKEIVTVGRLTSQKNHRLLIDSFFEFVEQYSDYSLKIYGDGPLKQELEKHISNIGLSNKVELMGTRKKVMNYVSESEIFVLASNFEGFPNVLIEAMATGLPVISSDFSTGVAKMLISNGENGYVFEVNNKQALTKAMLELMTIRDRFNEMGKENREIAFCYKADVVAKRWIETIKDIL